MKKSSDSPHHKSQSQQRGNKPTVLPPEEGAPMDRRDFLKRSAVVASGIAALVASLSPLRDFKTETSAQEFFQKHYKEMTPEEMQKVLDRISVEIEKRYQIRPELKDVKAMDGVEFAYALNISRCIGCRRCVHACVEENNQSRDPEIQYIRVLKMPQGTMNMEQGDHHYDVNLVPEEGHFYMPVQCHQCRKPPCVKVCPTEATWQEPDGVTVIDYNWCIGCRYCEAACPYWARRFNFSKPKIPKEDINPKMNYLSNQPRKQGVMEKCTFCLQRTREGKYPACLEACPTGSRIFGNILDPNSPINYVFKTKRVFVLKEEAKTIPRFYYYFEK